MAKITSSVVSYVAKLSKLNLTSEEVKKFTPQLASIVEYVSQLQEVDTDNTQPTSQTTGLTDVTREDVVKPQEINLQSEYFEVEKILKNRTDK